MAKSDYYDILGVSRDANEATIKSAYRKLAREWHPDVNKSANASKRFAEVQEAYDVLSDPQKRKQYDRFGHVGVGSGGSGEGSRAGGWSGSGPGPGGVQYEWSSGGPGAGGDAGFDAGSIFEEFFGRGRGGPRGGPRGRAPQQQIAGQNITHTITIPFDVAIRGGKESLRFSLGNTTEEIDITIPTGIADGSKLRVRGKGQPSPTGGKAGDLILTVKVARHPWFRRSGLDILIDVPITISEAVLGAAIEVPTVYGSVVTIKVPESSQSGQKLRVPRQGIKKPDGTVGDFLAVLKVQTPDDVSDVDKTFFRKLGERLPSPRTGPPWM